MRALSLSAAWLETKAILARDGKLIMSVALALIAFPTVVSSIINPGTMTASSAPMWVNLVAILVTIIALAGQLALIRLAIGPSVTVGNAIVHGLKRMPIYLLSVTLIVLGLVALAIPLVLLLSVLGVPITAGKSGAQLPAGPAAALVGLLYIAAIAFIAVRFILSAPVASAEKLGPVAIIRRSWDLTAGHWWKLLGFLALFLVGTLITLLAIGSALGVVIRLLLGPIEPMSAAALVFALVQSLISAGVSSLFAVMLARIYLQLSGTAEQVGEVFR